MKAVGGPKNRKELMNNEILSLFNKFAKSEILHWHGE
jgi:hypothetical protein